MDHFTKLHDVAKRYAVNGRTDSAALLVWFLEHIFRLDDIDAQDAVCDGALDFGIDAVVVSDPEEEIYVFQCKRVEKSTRGLGNASLTPFVGALEHLKTKARVETLIRSTTNTDLKTLLIDGKVADKCETYRLRPVFVTNAAATADAYAYIRTVAADDGLVIDLWDRNRIGPVLDQMDREWAIENAISLRLDPGQFFFSGPQTKVDLFIGAIEAIELIRLPGISDYRLFAQNVRLGLGKTRVNQDIERAVQRQEDHPNFLSFHNGLTIVCRSLAISRNRLRMNQYSVCNGCQSLITLHRNAGVLTDSLRLVVRVVRVAEGRELAEEIAYRTNNQNPISLRDLSANDATQLQLEADFNSRYGDKSVYGIKRGATTGSDVLSNEAAGLMLLALYSRQPWSAHQKYRVFGDLYGQIFRYGISATHIRLAQLLFEEVKGAIPTIGNERVRGYGLTTHIVLYLLGEILRKEPAGLTLLEAPLKYVADRSGLNKKREAALLQKVRAILQELVLELNYVIEESEDFDYKRVFKSQKQVGELASQILKAYEKDKKRGKSTVFDVV